jgi:hypothetical protein
VATDDTRETKSNGAGDFTFSVLPVGNYELDIKVQGFQELKEGGIHLDPGDQRSLHEIKLTPGETSTTVTVRTATEAITLDSGEASTMISAEAIRNLSVEGRDVTELLNILPGFAITNGNNNLNNTTYDPSQVTITGAYGSYSGEGTITHSVALLYNGIDVTTPAPTPACCRTSTMTR